MRKTKQSSSLPKYYFQTPIPDPTPKWRIQNNQTQLVSQASTILLQRHTKLWNPLLKSLNLYSNFTPSVFHQILNKIQTHPQICLRFFNWAKRYLAFDPDLETRCDLTRLLFGSKCGNPVLDSIVQYYPPAQFVALLIKFDRCGNFMNASPVLSSVIECCCRNDKYLQSLEVYNMARQYGAGLSVNSCNMVLRLLADKDGIRLAWCFYASMIRNGVSSDKCTRYLIAKILCRQGKLERVSMVLDLETCTPDMFDMIVEGYSERGDFEAAFRYLDTMCRRRIRPSFGTYCSILDGACKYRDKDVIGSVIRLMVERGLLSDTPVYDYDLIIGKLCDLGKAHAVDFFFKKSCDENTELLEATYGSIFRVFLLDKGKLMDAVELYYTMREKNVGMDMSCHNKFVIALCNESPSEKVCKLLVGIIEKGLGSAPAELSSFIRRTCAEGLWKEAEELLGLTLGRGWLLDSSCYGCFVRHYCSNRQMDSAIILHNRLEELKGTVDVATINIFLAVLFRRKRIEEIMKFFYYNRTCKNLNSESFSLMIRGLCREKEMRKAMELHDEMLELGLKPDRSSYKRLIAGFK